MKKAIKIALIIVAATAVLAVFGYFALTALLVTAPQLDAAPPPTGNPAQTTAPQTAALTLVADFTSGSPEPQC
jgi:flagellar basal body-associated protein FliL